MKLYHSDLFIPAELRAQAHSAHFKKLVWSRHAQLELVRDPYGIVCTSEIPHKFDAHYWTLVELEVVNGKITKYVYRRPVDSIRSLVIVLRPGAEGEATVTTCWTNRNDDKHATLDKSKYASS